ncbi:Cyclic-nucleotide gated cation channel [Reticulomyxa filosa]|uniref:Cyclic-nucleotide gated cation channel n=1 Tax=Reticulomyxa filosa TaxID=46433 RepID=X6MH78_RETFI|nr:Cyclic-nucleotide gated cation channel [Reticulomyxa filosa]|eukprot:ETO12385.1 Cyclic-nucleotide gated cation channel [Reticulomyxa filosa]
MLMYAVIVGSITSLLRSMDTPGGKRQERTSVVQEYLRQRAVSSDLTERILHGHDEKILQDVHTVLKEQLFLEINQPLLQKMDCFKELPKTLLLILVHQLITRIYLPNETVFLIGERALEVFFVVRGDLEELDKEGKSLHRYKDGDCFGDQLFEYNARRRASVRCSTHCELLILTAWALKKITQSFPEFAMLLAQWSLDDAKNLTKWKKVRKAVHTTRIMRAKGAKVTVEQVFKAMNGASVWNDKFDLRTLQPGNNELTYLKFKKEFAAAQKKKFFFLFLTLNFRFIQLTFYFLEMQIAIRNNLHILILTGFFVKKQVVDFN